jgi:hypothetical protein
MLVKVDELTAERDRLIQRDENTRVPKSMSRHIFVVMDRALRCRMLNLSSVWSIWHHPCHTNRPVFNARSYLKGLTETPRLGTNNNY